MPRFRGGSGGSQRASQGAYSARPGWVIRTLTMRRQESVDPASVILTVADADVTRRKVGRSKAMTNCLSSVAFNEAALLLSTGLPPVPAPIKEFACLDVLKLPKLLAIPYAGSCQVLVARLLHACRIVPRQHVPTNTRHG